MIYDSACYDLLLFIYLFCIAVGLLHCLVIFIILIRKTAPVSGDLCLQNAGIARLLLLGIMIIIINQRISLSSKEHLIK